MSNSQTEPGTKLFAKVIRRGRKVAASKESKKVINVTFYSDLQGVLSVAGMGLHVLNMFI